VVDNHSKKRGGQKASRLYRETFKADPQGPQEAKKEFNQKGSENKGGGGRQMRRVGQTKRLGAVPRRLPRELSLREILAGGKENYKGSREERGLRSNPFASGKIPRRGGTSRGNS